MAKDKDRIQTGILGDINPTPSATDRGSSENPERDRESDESMSGGSRHDRTEHSGSRDVTEGVTGGTGTETGGTPQLSSGHRRDRGDIGNRPE